MQPCTITIGKCLSWKWRASAPTCTSTVSSSWNIRNLLRELFKKSCIFRRDGAGHTSSRRRSSTHLCKLPLGALGSSDFSWTSLMENQRASNTEGRRGILPVASRKSFSAKVECEWPTHALWSGMNSFTSGVSSCCPTWLPVWGRHPLKSAYGYANARFLLYALMFTEQQSGMNASTWSGFVFMASWQRLCAWSSAEMLLACKLLSRCGMRTSLMRNAKPGCTVR